MDLRRNERTRKLRTVWEQKDAPSAVSDPKLSKKSVRTIEKTTLKPVAIRPFPLQITLQRNDLSDLSDYTSSLKL